jgi:hypothetical protein
MTTARQDMIQGILARGIGERVLVRTSTLEINDVLNGYGVSLISTYDAEESTMVVLEQTFILEFDSSGEMSFTADEIKSIEVLSS